MAKGTRNIPERTVRKAVRRNRPLRDVVVVESNESSTRNKNVGAGEKDILVPIVEKGATIKNLKRQTSKK